jgi:type IV secretion system protein VirD4
MTRKTMALAVSVLVYLVVGYVVAQTLAGVLYFLTNKAIPTDLRADTFGRYWAAYANHPVQRKRLQLSAAIAFGLVYLAPLCAAVTILNQRRSLHGDARFARRSEVRKAGLYAEHGIIVGKYRGRYLIFEGQQFVLLAAPTRSMKGVAVVIPNLLNFPDSVVTLDLKLENFKYTSRFRERHGQQVYLFNPFAEDGKSHRWNVLDTVSRTGHARVGEVLAIAQALYPSDCDQREKFWNDNARNLFLGLVLYLLDTPDLPCTFGELLRQSSGKGQPLQDYLQTIIAARANGEQVLSDACLDALNRFVSTPENTLGNILSTFNAPLLIFADPIVDAATSASDFDITQVRKRKMSIYFGIQPNRLADASLLINLFFSQLINLNIKELPQNNPALKYQCLLINDEFTAMGKVGIIAKANAFIAGYNLRLLTIIQSVSQLESVYGERDTRTLVTNHALQILYPPREQKDANAYSEMLGYFTEKSVSTGTSQQRGWGSAGSISENRSEQKRALMLPQELKELDQRKEIVMLEHTKPILCDKARYFDDATFIDRLKAVSPSLRALGRTLPTKAQLERAAFVTGELSIPVPTVDIARHQTRAERRARPLAAGEPIDLSTLALDTDRLPPLDDADNPSPQSVANLVDAFFSQLDWIDEPAQENVCASTSGAANTAAGDAHVIELAQPDRTGSGHSVPDKAEPTAATERPSRTRTAPPAKSGGTIDLSVLDR